MVADPDHALDCALVRSGSTAIREHVRLRIGAAEIEHAHFLFLAAREEVGRARGDSDGADDVIVGEGVEGLAGVGVPDLAKSQRIAVQHKSVRGEEAIEWTYAVKSALPEAAREVSGESLLLHTAPLWPMNVPIQSPVHSRSIGFPSLQLDMSTYVLSSWRAEKERCVTGRVWPGATSGTALGGMNDICVGEKSKGRRWE